MGTFRNILVVDDEPSIRHVLTLVLREQGYDVRSVADGREAMAELDARTYDVVISDVRMPTVDGMALLKHVVGNFPDITFLVMSAHGAPEAALEAVGLGAYDYISKPFQPEEMVLVLKKAEERQRLVRENKRLRKADLPGGPLGRLLGQSDVMQTLHRNIRKVAPVSTTVLVTGESGTGKELVARALHELSPRAAESFVAVNCGAIPAGLIESELFGHAKGAFTDARAAKRGMVAEADGGTLFLDEIGELPLAAQTKLLRFLQEGEVRPVGENKAEKVNVRVIAATLRDLASAVAKGEFREDLYYRLNVMQMHVPPLRERRDDIPLLAGTFLPRFTRAFNRGADITGFAPETEAALRAYDWPGNVRELENAIERGVLLADGPLLLVENLPERISTPPKAAPSPVSLTENLSLKRAIRELEETFIRRALARTRGNRTRAAEILEISHRTLLYKLKEYAIDADAEGERSS